MARLTKREQGEIVETFYGINPKTFEVESVYLTRGNVLHWHGNGDRSASHPVLFGRSARTEIIVVWGLTDLESVYPGTNDTEHRKTLVSKLRQLAAEKKKAAETAS